jgi:hypothetical protein
MRKYFTLAIPAPQQHPWGISQSLAGSYFKREKSIQIPTWNNDPVTPIFKSRSVNGRFYPAQLKNYIAIDENAPAFKWFPFSLLSVTLLFSSRSAEQKKSKDDNVRSLNGSNAMVMRIQGMVKYATDQSPLPGVTITLKGTQQSATTDEEGRFSILISDPQATDSLLFSFIGLETTSYNIYESTDLAVYMKDDFNMLGETIIVKDENFGLFRMKELWWWIKNVFQFILLSPKRK